MPVSLLQKKQVQKGPTVSISFFRQNIQAVAAAGVLFFVVLVYGGFLGYEALLYRELEKIRDQVKMIQDQRDIAAEEGARDLGERVRKISSLLDTHPHSTKLFGFVEDATHRQVQFTNFSFEITDGSLTLEGVTPNYVTFGEQIIAFDQNEKISGVEVMNVKRDRGGKIEFEVKLEVEEEVYR